MDHNFGHTSKKELTLYSLKARLLYIIADRVCFEKRVSYGASYIRWIPLGGKILALWLGNYIIVSYRALCDCLHSLTFHTSNLVDYWGAVFRVWRILSSHHVLKYLCLLRFFQFVWIYRSHYDDHTSDHVTIGSFYSFYKLLFTSHKTI